MPFKHDQDYQFTAEALVCQLGRHLSHTVYGTGSNANVGSWNKPGT
jgi:hypothetical protein